MSAEKNDFNVNLDWEFTKRQDELIRLRRDFHAHPELSFQEDRTARIVSDLMEKKGFKVPVKSARPGS